MRSARRLITVAAVGFLFTIGACQDQTAPTAPDVAPPDAPTELLGTTRSLLGTGNRQGPEVDVIQRREALVSDEVARARVGLLGATLHLPRSGLTVHIPAGAAPVGTRIEVRAPAGDLVGYHFSPHGLQFRLPVTLVQDLSRAGLDERLLNRLRGAYFDGPLLPSVLALELVPLRVEGGVLGQAILTINHFSGYVIATN